MFGPQRRGRVDADVLQGDARRLVGLLERVDQRTARGGEVDIAWGIPDDQLPAVQSESSLTVQTVQSTAVFTMWFNSSIPALQQAAVRRALWQAVDFQNIIKQLYPQTGTLSEGVVSPQTLGFVKQEPVRYDPTAAKAALTAAGFDFTKKLRLQFANAEFRPFNQAVVSELQKIGVQIDLLDGYRPIGVAVDGDMITGVTVASSGGHTHELAAPYVIDATELGDLPPLAGVEHVTGFESRAQTGEPNAPEHAQPANMQAFSWVFAVDHRAGEDHTIDRPPGYAEWARYQPPGWPGPLLSLIAPDPRTLETVERTFVPNTEDGPVVADQSKDAGDKDLWVFRRILFRRVLRPGFAASDITVVNWPMIDYLPGPIIGVSEEERAKHLEGSRELSLSMLYWLQTEAPRPDGGAGWRGLRLRGDVMGTADGLAKAPYIRESRRITAKRTVVEQDLSFAVRGTAGAVAYPDSVGVGMYRIDLHPSTGGDTYIDVASCPFQIPLGALIPVRLRNLLPAGKNIGTTHITNGCYRLHPVEWNVGEVAGALAAHCLANGTEPHQVHATGHRLRTFQDELVADGVELAWPQVKGY